MMFIKFGEGLSLAIILTGFTTLVVCIDGQKKNLSQTLWEDSLEIAFKAFETPFVQGLRFGTLSPTKFGAYMVQDAVYLEKLSETLMVASKNVQRNKGIIFKEFFLEQATNYMRYANDLYHDWQIAESSAVKLGGACKAYTDYQLDVATKMYPIYTITAMIPCVKLWPWIGQQLQEGNNTFGVYQDWIVYNFDPTYDGYTKLDNWVDEWHARGLIDENKAKDVYENCMKGEYLFFDRAMP